MLLFLKNIKWENKTDQSEPKKWSMNPSSSRSRTEQRKEYGIRGCFWHELVWPSAVELIFSKLQTWSVPALRQTSKQLEGFKLITDPGLTCRHVSVKTAQYPGSGCRKHDMWITVYGRCDLCPHQTGLLIESDSEQERQKERSCLVTVRLPHAPLCFITHTRTRSCFQKLLWTWKREEMSQFVLPLLVSVSSIDPSSSLWVLITYPQ